MESCKSGMNLDETIESFKTYMHSTEKRSQVDPTTIACSSSGFRKHVIKKIIDYVTKR